MPIIKSAIKKMRQDRSRTQSNRATEAAYFRITNVTNTALSFHAHLGTVTAMGGAVIRNSSAAVSIGAGQSANVSLNSGTITDFITNAALDQGIWFGVTTTYANTIRVPENFALSFYFSP